VATRLDRGRIPRRVVTTSSKGVHNKFSQR
jgi:hypothetical protein